MLWCVPAFPLAAFLLLLFCSFFPRFIIKIIGASFIFMSFMAPPPERGLPLAVRVLGSGTFG